MPTILSIQSSVAYGHVGNSAATFPLMRMGVEVWPVLTVHFSNHTGYGQWRGPLLAAADIAEVIRGIDDRGVLGQVDAVLSGYQGGEDVGAVILDAVDLVRQRNPDGLLLLRSGARRRGSRLLRAARHPRTDARSGGAGGQDHHAEPVRAGGADR